MERTYSQKVARVFEIIDYFLLIPAAIGALVGFFILFGSPLLGGLIYAGLGIGIALMVGYIKHSRGKLSQDYISFLWIGTAIYNFMLLMPWLYWVAISLQPSGGFDEEDKPWGGYIFLMSIVLGYIFAIVFSIKAYSFEKRKAFYQRNQALKSFDKIENVES